MGDRTRVRGNGLSPFFLRLKAIDRYVFAFVYAPMLDTSRDDRVSFLRRQVEDLMQEGRWTEAAPCAAAAADEHASDAFLQRLASGCLSQTGDFAKARSFAARAVALAPDQADYVQHYGIVLNVCGDPVAAIAELKRAASLSRRQPETYHQLAFAFAQLGNVATAAELALFAARIDPESEARKLAAAHYLAQASRVEDALDILRVDASPNACSAVVLRTRSGLLGQLARFDEALLAIDQAILLHPQAAELHLHRSGVLHQMQRGDDALAAALRAVELDPASRSARRHAVSVLAASGAIAEAVRHGGALLALAPDEPEYLSCMAYLLEAKAMHGVARDFEDIAALKRLGPPRKLRPPPTFADKLRLQGRSIKALVLRDIRSRYGDSRFGFFWTLMEPFVHVGFLALVFEFTMHGHPPLGTNFFFFYFTGVMPYLLMSHLTMGLGHVVRGNKNLLQIAQVTPFDLMLAKAIVEVFTSSLIYLLFSALFALGGLDPTPLYASSVAEAFGLTIALGVGTGMICSTLFEFGPAGESLVNILLRILYFASGIFYVPANMPMLTRDLLAYNPFLHIIDTVRMGYFADYEPSWNDPGYAGIFAILTLALGMLAVNIFGRRMRSIP